MNTTLAPRTTTTLASIALAALFTVAMLLGVDGLAAHEGGAPLMAKAAASAPRA